MTALWATSSGDVLIHGSPNWVDLYAEDADASQRFYADLLGWRFQHRFSLSPVATPGNPRHPIEEARATLLAFCGGKPSAEIIERDDLFADMLLPSRWYPFLYVDDIETTVRRVQAAGGNVVRSPHARGSMATVSTVVDPSGAMFGLWEPGDHSGNSFAYSGGCLTWLELRTPDVAEARRFYGRVFGWRPTDEPPEVPTAPVLHNYTIFSTAVGPVAGAVGTSGMSSASWYPSFSVPDVEQAASKADFHGALTVTRAHDLTIGRQCSVVDPEGAEFSLIGPRRQAKTNRFRTRIRHGR